MSKLDEALKKIYAGQGGFDDTPSGADFSYLSGPTTVPTKEAEKEEGGLFSGGLLSDVLDSFDVGVNTVGTGVIATARQFGKMAGAKYDHDDAETYRKMILGSHGENFAGVDIISGAPEKGLTFGVFKGPSAPAGSIFQSDPHPLVRAGLGIGLEAAIDPLNFVSPAGKVHGAANIAGQITEEFAKKAASISGRELTPEVIEGLIKGQASFNDIVSLPAGHPQAVELEQLRSRAAQAVQSARRGGASKLTADEIMEFGGGKIAKGMVLDFGPIGQVRLTTGGGPIGAASVWRHRAQMALGDVLLSKGGTPVRFGKNIANAATEAKARSSLDPREMMDATIARRLRRTARFMDEAATNQAARTTTAAMEEVRREFKLSKEALDEAIEEAHLIIDGGLNPAEATPEGQRMAEAISAAMKSHAEQRVAGGAATEDTLLQEGTYFPSPVTQEGREAFVAAGLHPDEEVTAGNRLFINQRRKLYDESSGIAGIGLDGETTRRLTKTKVKNRAEAEQWAGEELARVLKEKADAGDERALEFLADHPDLASQVEEGYIRIFKTGREALVAEAKATGRSVARARLGRRLFELGYGIVDPRAVKGYVNYGMTPDGVEDLKMFTATEAERYQEIADMQRDARSAADEFEAEGLPPEPRGDLEDTLEASLRGDEGPEPTGGTPAPPTEPRGPAPAAGGRKLVRDQTLDELQATKADIEQALVARGRAMYSTEGAVPIIQPGEFPLYDEVVRRIEELRAAGDGVAVQADEMASGGISPERPPEGPVPGATPSAVPGATETGPVSPASDWIGSEQPRLGGTPTEMSREEWVAEYERLRESTARSTKDYVTFGPDGPTFSANAPKKVREFIEGGGDINTRAYSVAAGYTPQEQKDFARWIEMNVDSGAQHAQEDAAALWDAANNVADEPLQAATPVSAGTIEEAAPTGPRFDYDEFMARAQEEDVDLGAQRLRTEGRAEAVEGLLPPKRAGTTRYYNGGGTNWWTPNIKRGLSYAQGSAAGENSLRYLDLDPQEAAAFRAANEAAQSGQPVAGDIAINEVTNPELTPILNRQAAPDPRVWRRLDQAEAAAHSVDPAAEAGDIGAFATPEEQIDPSEAGYDLAASPKQAVEDALEPLGWKAEGSMPTTAKRIVVTGGRDEVHPEQARAIIDALKAKYGDDIVVVHGAARGADNTFAEAAEAAGLQTEAHPADWKGKGRGAGFIRNTEMAKSGVDLAVVFPGGRGTAHMTGQVEKAGVPSIKVGPGTRAPSVTEVAETVAERAAIDARVTEGIEATKSAFASAKQALADIAALPKDDWKEVGLGAAVADIRRVANDLGLDPNLSADELLSAVKRAVKDFDDNPEVYAATVRARIHGKAAEDAAIAQYGLDVAGRTQRKKIRVRKPWTPEERAEHTRLRTLIWRTSRLRDDAYTELRAAEAELREINARGPAVVSATNERLDARIAALNAENDKLRRGVELKMALDEEAELAEATRRANEDPLGSGDDIANAMNRYQEGAVRPSEDDIVAAYNKKRYKKTPAELQTDKKARDAAEAAIKANERKMERLERMKAESPETTTVTDADLAIAKIDAAYEETKRLKQIIEDAKVKVPAKKNKYATFETRFEDVPVEGSPMFEAQRRFEDTVRQAEAKQLAEPLPEKSERFVPGQSPLRDFETNELVRGYEGTRTSSAAKITARNTKGDVVEAATLKAHAERIQQEWTDLAASAQEHEYLRDAFAAYKAALDEAIPASPARDLMALADSQVDRAGMLANEPSQVDAMADDVIHEAEVVSMGTIEDEPPTALFENVGSGGPRRGRPGAGRPKPPTKGPLLGPPAPRTAVPKAYIDAAKRRKDQVKGWKKVYDSAIEVGDSAMAEVARLRIMAAKLSNEADLAHAAVRDTALEAHGIESMWAEAAQHNTLLQKGVADFATHRMLAPGLLAPNDMVDMVLQTDAIFRDPATMSKFQKAWQRSLHWMRVWQITSPGFHIRNMFGGVFNNALADVNAESYGKFMSLWRKGRDGGKLTPEELRIWNQVTQIASPGQVGSEAIGSPVGRLAGEAALSRNPIGIVVGSKGALPRLSENAASNVEFYLRGTLAYDVIAKGGTIDDAAEAIAKFHFDYHDASRGEQWLKANAVPFLTWTRHNLPLQLEMMIEHPSTYSKFTIFKKNMERVSTADPVKPGYFSEIQAVRLPFLSGGGHTYYVPDLPFRDVHLATGPIDALVSGEGDAGDRALDALGEPVSMLTPLISGPIEWGLGKQFYKGIPLRGDRGIALSDLHIPNWLATPLTLTPLVKRGSNGRAYITEKDFYILEKSIPILARVRRLGASKEKKQQDKLMSRAISFFAGAQVRTNNEEDQKIANYINELEDKRKKTISYGLGAPRPSRGGSVL